LLDSLLQETTMYCLVITLLLSVCRAQHQVSGPEYTRLPAPTKQALIWENVVSNSSSGSWPGAKIVGIFNQSMCPTLQQKGDEYSPPRQKYLHSVGSVGKVEFVPANSSGYSGIFQGAEYGIIRISLAGQRSSTMNNTSPGMALKFLRDGVESASLVAMYHVLGQESWNVFANDWSNHIASVTAAQGGPLLNLFASGTPNIQQVGLSDFAQIGEDGRKVDPCDVIFPYKLVFRPTGSIMFPDAYHGEISADLAGIAEDSVLWEVYAWDAPEQLNGTEEFIGEIVLRSKLVTSLWGDENLFFRHQDMREDFVLKPEWKNSTEEVVLANVTTCNITTVAEGCDHGEGDEHDHHEDHGHDHHGEHEHDHHGDHEHDHHGDHEHDHHEDHEHDHHGEEDGHDHHNDE